MSLYAALAMWAILGGVVVVAVAVLDSVRVRRRARKAAHAEIVAWMRANKYVTIADRVARAFEVHE